MRPAPFDYEAPRSAGAAAELLAAARGREAVVLAGGQTLVPQMIRRSVCPELVVDINRIDELDYVTVDARGHARIGALVRHEHLVRSHALREHWPVLGGACGHVSNAVVRRRGTIGGSIAWRDGRSEVAAALLACDAGVVVRSSRAAVREVPVGDVLEPDASGLHPDELIVEVTLGAPDGASSWGVSEFASRRWDPAVGGAVCRIAWDAGGAPAAARVVAFGELERPVRLAGVEAAILEGAQPRSLQGAVASEAEDAVGAVGTVRAQCDRTWLAAVIADCVKRAIEQARAEGGLVAR